MRLTSKLDVFLDDGRLDLVIGVRGYRNNSSRRIGCPAEFLDVRCKLIPCTPKIVRLSVVV